MNCKRRNFDAMTAAQKLCAAVLFAFIFLPKIGLSQLDIEHFIPPVYPSTHGWVYPREQVVYVSTPTVTPFNYTIKDGAGNVLKAGLVSNANPISYQMQAYASDFVVTDADLNKVLPDRGLHIEADEKVYCNLRAQAGGGTRPNATSMTAKGRAALGTAFRIGHFPSPSAHINKSSTVGIYAAEDGTNISIDLTGRQPVLRGAGAPSTATVINITLNKGETYVFAIKGSDSPLNRNLGMIGGLITSNKGIVVNCGSWGGNFTNNDVMDIGMDQIVGADKIGTEYAVVRGALTRNNPQHERVLIIAHEANTEVKVNGVVVATIANAGGVYYVPSNKYAANGSMFIETSKPAYAYQFMMGANDYHYKTQGMNFLPPISCKTTSFVDNIPFIEKISTKNYGGAISVVTIKGSTVTVTADGVVKNKGTAKAIPGSNYEMYKIGGLTGNVAVYSTTIALVSIVGQNSAAGYGGFFSGFVETKISQEVNCLPGYLFESTGQMGTFRWFKDGTEIPGETNDSLFATETGDYTFERSLAGCKDTSAVMPAVGVNKFSFAGDTEFCPGDSTQVSIIGSGFDSLSWETGEKTTSVTLKSYGETDVRIYSDVTKECFVDTSIITTAIICPVNLILGDSITICKGDTGLVQAINLTGPTWTGDSLLAINDSTVNVYPIETTTYHVERFLSRGDLLINSDFEDVNLAGTNAQLDASLVNGWETTASDNKIEIWRNGFLGHPSYSGELFAELNATEPSALYQDITTVPGETIKWGFAHRGRVTNETMLLKVGPPEGTYEIIGYYTDGPTAWGYYSGEYVVPAGQTLTRFLFSAVDLNTTANLIDAATFEAFHKQEDSIVVVVNEPPVITIADSTICTGDSMQLDAQNAGSSFLWSSTETTQTIHIKQNGEYHVAVTDENGCVGRDTMTLVLKSCNTDAAITKTDGRDDYTPGTTTEYTIVAKNLGPANFSNGIVSDPLPSGVSAGEVSWDATAYGGAITTAVGSQEGALNDVVSIPVGDSIVYKVNIAVPFSYKGDLTNTVTIAVDIDTNATNDIATDLDFNGLCVGATVSSFAEQFNTGIKINPGENDPNWTIQWINDPAYHVYSANSYANPTSNAVIPAVGMNKAAGVWGDASYPDYLWVCYPWTGANNGPGIHSDVDGDGVVNEYSNLNNIAGATGDAVILKFSKTFEMTAAQLEASELSFGIAADNNIMDIIVNGVSQGPKALGSYNLVPHTITNDFQLGTNTVEIIVNSGPGAAGIMIANSTIKAVDSVSLVITDPPLACAPNQVDITDSLWTVGSINMGTNTYFTDSLATIPYTTPLTADSGSYYIVTTTLLGCYDTAKINVSQNPLPDVILRSDTSFCKGGSVTLSAGSIPNLTLDWNGGQKTEAISVDSTGMYKLTGTNTYGCSDSDSVQVTVHPLPTVSLRNDTNICFGDSIPLDAQNSGSNYLWNTTETTQTISIKNAGAYDVIVTDGFGCEGKDTMNLIINSLPIVDLGPDVALCDPSTHTLDAGIFDAYLWNDLSVGQEVTFTSTVKSYVQVTDSKGCKGSDTAQITINPLPVVSVGIDLEICDGDSVLLNGLNSTASHSWNTGASTQQITIKTTGTYGVEVTDTNGCFGSDSMDLVVYDLPVVNIGNDTTICDGETVVADAGSWTLVLWGGQISSQTIPITTTTKTHVDIVDANGCAGSDTISVTVNPIPVINLGNDTTLCVDESITLDAGNPSLNHLWNTGEITQTITGIEGKYKVTVSDDIGCFMSDSMLIIIEEITDPFIKKTYEFCPGDSAELWADDNVNDYAITWPGISNESSYIATETGIHTSTATGQYCSANFDLISTKLDTPDVSIVNLTKKPTVCFDIQSIFLEVLGPDLDRIDILWSTGETALDIEVIEPGTYSILATGTCESRHEVELQEFCPANLFVPNAFTPSGGGINDIWMPVGHHLSDYKVQVWNRWGQLIFTSNNLYEGWDGTFNGTDAQQDVYVFKLFYSHELESGLMEKESMVGTVTLIR